MSDLPFKEQDLYSFGGLALVVPMVVGGLKHFFEKWINGKEPIVALIATYVLGVSAKLAAPKVAFPGVSWIGLVIGLFFVALAAQLTHDKVINPVIKGQDASSGSTAPKLILLLLIPCLLLGGCCSVQKEGVESLGRTQDLLNTELLKYVQDDAYKPKLSDAQKSDWAKLVQSEKDLRAGLIKR